MQKITKAYFDIKAITLSYCIKKEKLKCFIKIDLKVKN